MLVVDASCLYEVVAKTPMAEAVRERMARDTDHAAPHLVDAEVLGTVRRRLLVRDLDETAAHQAVEDLRDWRGERFDHHGLLARAWELHHEVRSWDALYVALAEALAAVLLTQDGRLGRARGLRCHVEVVPT
ncbi:MAG: type II toxin-antitoxin system VapC family toxin [Chloroflexota bacterium]